VQIWKQKPKKVKSQNYGSLRPIAVRCRGNKLCARLSSRHLINICGIITVRLRPGTATGVVFSMPQAEYDTVNLISGQVCPANFAGMVLIRFMTLLG
jgi:hypothetical protein